MAHFIYGGQPANLVQAPVCRTLLLELWGGGPGGEPLNVTASPPGIVRIEEVPRCVRPHIREFHVTAQQAGAVRIEARTPCGDRLWALTRGLFGASGDILRYYHGTTLEAAWTLFDLTLTPQAVAALTIADWTEYTDFGKGLYVHAEENKQHAYDWAKRRYPKKWAVLEFILPGCDVQEIRRAGLLFRTKADRPANSPVLPGAPQVSLGCSVVLQRASWLEFVEHNRHIERGRPMIMRPSDRDWSAAYSFIRGPIWVPRDSGYPVGGQPFPDHLHQINWGQAGLARLNGRKELRFVFDAGNEDLYPARRARAPVCVPAL